MSWFSKQEEDPVKPKSYTVKTTVVKGRSKYDSYDTYTITVEGSGFTGTATESSMSSAFEKAYDNLMHQVSQAIFNDNG